MRILTIILAVAVIGQAIYLTHSTRKWKDLVHKTQETTERALDQAAKATPISDQRQLSDVMVVYKNAWFHGYQAAVYAKPMNTTWPADSTSFARKFFGR